MELTRKYHSPTLTMDGSGEKPGTMGLEGDIVAAVSVSALLEKLDLFEMAVGIGS